MPVTAADIWRLYVKPSLGGQIIFRNKATHHSSARIAAVNKRVADNPPAARASQACIAAGRSKTVVKYKGGTRVVEQAADIACFRSQLRKEMLALVGGGAGAALPS